MVRTCPSTMAPPSASASGATSATKTLNNFLESSSPTAETITAKAVGLGTEVFEANRLCHSGVVERFSILMARPVVFLVPASMAEVLRMLLQGGALPEEEL